MFYILFTLLAHNGYGNINISNMYDKYDIQCYKDEMHITVIIILIIILIIIAIILI